MPNLGALNTITVTGKYVFLDDQVATSGTVTFEAVGVDLREPAANLIILGTPITVAVGAQGTFSIALPATDDPDVTPTGFVYKVTEAIPHPVTAKVRGRTFNIQVPVDSPGGTLDLADVASTESVTPSAQYTLQTTHNVHIADTGNPHAAAKYLRRLVVAVTPQAGVATLDLSQGDYFVVTDPGSDFAVALTNTPAATHASEVFVRLAIGGAARSVTWPAAVSGAPEVFEANAVRTVHLRTWDAGVSWTPAAATAVGYTADLGDGAETSYTVTHGLGTRNVLWQLTENATGNKYVDAGRVIDLNNIFVPFEEIPTVAQYRINVVGILS